MLMQIDGIATKQFEIHVSKCVGEEVVGSDHCQFRAFEKLMMKKQKWERGLT